MSSCATKRCPSWAGRELLDAMRAEPRLATIPLILMAETWGRALPQIDGAIVLGKPIRLAELFDHVERAGNKPRRQP
jgi:hypothetical protein